MLSGTHGLARKSGVGLIGGADAHSANIRPREQLMIVLAGLRAIESGQLSRAPGHGVGQRNQAAVRVARIFRRMAQSGDRSAADNSNTQHNQTLPPINCSKHIIIPPKSK